MELTDLVGEHELSGVDFLVSKEELWHEFVDCQVINFVLDGVTYSALEDPEDGYRSCMKEIIVSDAKVTNQFAGQRVLAAMRADNQYETHDILDFTDVVTSKVVLSVGTGNTDDYYPYWVAEFVPENMAINAGR